MKKIIAFLVLCSVTAFAVDIETVVDSKFSTPSSIRPAFQQVDKNLANLKVAVEAAQATATAGITGITPTFTTNVYTFLDASTNAVAFTNISVRYTAVP